MEECQSPRAAEEKPTKWQIRQSAFSETEQTQQNGQGPQDNHRRCDVCPWGGHKERMGGMSGETPELQTQEAQRTSGRTNVQNTTPRRSTDKLQKIEGGNLAAQ